MKQKITFEKDRKLSKSSQVRIAEILRREGARNIKINVPEEGPDNSSGKKEGENGTRGNPEIS